MTRYCSQYNDFYGKTWVPPQTDQKDLCLSWVIWRKGTARYRECAVNISDTNTMHNYFQTTVVKATSPVGGSYLIGYTMWNMCYTYVIPTYHGRHLMAPLGRWDIRCLLTISFVILYNMSCCIGSCVTKDYLSWCKGLNSCFRLHQNE